MHCNDIKNKSFKIGIMEIRQVVKSESDIEDEFHEMLYFLILYYESRLMYNSLFYQILYLIEYNL